MKTILPQRYNVIEMFVKDGGYLESHYLGTLCKFKEAEAIIKGLEKALVETKRELLKLRKKNRVCKKCVSV